MVETLNRAIGSTYWDYTDIPPDPIVVPLELEITKEIIVRSDWVMNIENNYVFQAGLVTNAAVYDGDIMYSINNCRLATNEEIEQAMMEDIKKNTKFRISKAVQLSLTNDKSKVKDKDNPKVLTVLTNGNYSIDTLLEVLDKTDLELVVIPKEATSK
ncbi:hypothetical protein SP15_225 [Bacillus phage SP-15]|uniref:Uncharacterized protein n=1 Tax=Bacillus phage SP-15 TaxID=1792032 RepID=A0A127AWQ9_9CAUD|nr:hypothetical protein SP15_225 [Bacillus phage SP-15]AMM45027.1 hypothetical protein SP15_225 [Bacillus phage SP-15]